MMGLSTKFLEAQETLAQKRATMTEAERAALADPPPCPRCGGCGVYKSQHWTHGQGEHGGVVLQNCGCQSAARVQRLTRLSGMEDFAEDNFQDHPPKDGQEPYFAAAQEWITDPQGFLVLMGDFGRGKSHLAKCVGNALIASAQRITYRETSMMLDEIKRTFKDNSRVDTDELWQHFLSTPVLILDEFPSTHETPWVIDRLFTLINHRWQSHLATILTTNWTLDDFIDRHPKWAARIQDTRFSTVLDFGWGEA